MNVTSSALSLLVSALSAGVPEPAGSGSDEAQARTYRVRQSVVLSDIPQDAKKVRWWIAIPDDERNQEVLDMAVARAPGTWSLERDPEQGNRFLYVEVAKPSAPTLETVVEFTLRRYPVHVAVDPTRVGELSPEQLKFFVDELRLDAPHMQVTDDIRKMAASVCGDERNAALQADKLLEHVAGFADHYSKDPSKPKCGVGDAGDCITNRGGCCTDLHSLFISLARVRGIPARLQMGYRLLAKNLGNEVDPGYRCWPEFFLAGYGWVPADIVEADAVQGEERERWLSGLSERRVWLNQGREFVLSPRQEGPRVNTMVIGYAEIDGTPARVLPEGDKQPQLARKVRFVEVPEAETAALSSAKR